MIHSWFTIDRIVGLVLLAFSLLFAFLAFNLHVHIKPFFLGQPMRLDTMPRIIAVISIIASLVTILAPSTATREIRDEKTKEAKEKLKDLSFDNIGEFAVGQLGCMLALMCIFTLALRPAGFIVSTALFLFIASLILGERRWVGMALTALITPVLIWMLVTFVLDRRIPPLPSGLNQLLGY